MQVTRPIRQPIEDATVFDWRFAELRRAGLPPNAAWLLASDRGVDIRRAERLVAAGCPVRLMLEILL